MWVLNRSQSTAITKIQDAHTKKWHSNFRAKICRRLIGWPTILGKVARILENFPTPVVCYTRFCEQPSNNNTTGLIRVFLIPAIIFFLNIFFCVKPYIFNKIFLSIVACVRCVAVFCTRTKISGALLSGVGAAVCVWCCATCYL